jgi:hypothetical protein
MPLFYFLRLYRVKYDLPYNQPKYDLKTQSKLNIQNAFKYYFRSVRQELGGGVLC